MQEGIVHEAAREEDIGVVTEGVVAAMEGGHCVFCMTGWRFDVSSLDESGFGVVGEVGRRVCAGPFGYDLE